MSSFIKFLAVMVTMLAANVAFAVTVDVNHNPRDLVILKAGEPLVVELPLNLKAEGANAKWVVHDGASSKGVTFQKSEFVNGVQILSFTADTESTGSVMIGLTRAGWAENKYQRVFQFRYRVASK